MNCSDAQKVWGHKNGFLTGLQATFPGVLECLERIAGGLKNSTANPFCESVRRKVGTTSQPFFVEHAEDGDPLAEQVHAVVGDAAAKLLLETHFGKQLGIPIIFGNLCCGGCGASRGVLTFDETIAIQQAAIRTNIDGSEIVL